MPYLAMIDRFRSFLRKRRATLVLCGYSFGDEHLAGCPATGAGGQSDGCSVRPDARQLWIGHPSAIALAERQAEPHCHRRRCCSRRHPAWSLVTMADEGKAERGSRSGTSASSRGAARRDERRAAGRVELMRPDPTLLGLVDDVRGATVSVKLDPDTISGLSDDRRTCLPGRTDRQLRTDPDRLHQPIRRCFPGWCRRGTGEPA